MIAQREAADPLALTVGAPPDRQQDQTLATGAAGVALLHIERAHAGVGGWRTVHRWLTAAAGRHISAGDHAGLYVGAPALAFALHAAQADGIDRYANVLGELDAHVTTLAHRRVGLALARIQRGELPAFAEYDLFHGLTGIGAHLLRHTPGSDALGRVLAYLVRLTEPLQRNGETVPGWWVTHDPQLGQSPAFAGGHANFGIAHGITGPLALLAQARRAGLTVDGQREAIETICGWLDTWRTDTDHTSYWPQWITRQQHRTGRTNTHGPRRPSWCYGTPGLARAQQLAGLATGDHRRRLFAEHALATCLGDPAQLGQLTDASLCHGRAGLYLTTWHAAADASTPALGTHLPHLAHQLTQHSANHAGRGLLEGAAGVALALHTATRAAPPISRWTACLLID